LESARDLFFFELLDHVHPGVARAEEEADLGEVEVRVGVGEGDLRGVELEAACVCESEFVEGDDGPVIGSDLGFADLGEGGGDGEEDDEDP